MRFLAALLLSLIVGCIGPARPGAVEPVPRSVPDRALDGTVLIVHLLGLGSGIAWDGTHVLTAAHVLGPAMSVTTRTGEDCTIEGIYAEAELDVAVIEVSGCTLLPLVPGPPPVAGDRVWSAGAPMGLEWSVSRGVVSAVREGTVQIDAAINPGMSGGPTVDESGRLVGLNRAITTRDGMFAGIGWIIPVAVLSEVATRSVAASTRRDAGSTSTAGPG